MKNMNIEDSFHFTLKQKSTRSRARRGVLRTPHGSVETPAFVTVGTKATVKGLSPADLDLIGTQFVFANTYHLTLSPTPEVVEVHGGVHAMSGIQKPMITDSGGFQVFSLASRMPEHAPPTNNTRGEQDDDHVQPHLVKITEDGVIFHSHIDGTRHEFTPEYSIRVQQQIGADFMVAFDECIYNNATEAYTQKATQRTHEWAVRSLQAAQSTHETQRMYGVIQGGKFERLRHWSTETISEMPFFGIALGGVSVGETQEELQKQIGWMMDVLHEDVRPRHMLGISTFDDVVFAVKQGLDTFDCILPTRDARTGKIYVETGKDETGLPIIEKVKIADSRWKGSLDVFDEQMAPGVTYGYMHHLFKQRELLYYRYATMHNLYMMEKFFAQIREAIEDGRM